MCSASGQQRNCNDGDRGLPVALPSEPQSDPDESFLVLEGGLILEFDDRTVELLPGQMLTVRLGVRHRTRPMSERSVNLTFERADTATEMLPAV